MQRGYYSLKIAGISLNRKDAAILNLYHLESLHYYFSYFQFLVLLREQSSFHLHHIQKALSNSIDFMQSLDDWRPKESLS